MVVNNMVMEQYDSRKVVFKMVIEIFLEKKKIL